MTSLCRIGQDLWYKRQNARNSTEHAALCQQWHDHRAECAQCAKWREESNAMWGRKAKTAPVIDFDKAGAK
jgi:hypothetical protein